MLREILLLSLVFFNKKRNKVKKCICKTKNGKRRICDFFCQSLRQNYQKYSQKKTKDCINTGKGGKIEKRREQYEIYDVWNETPQEQKYTSAAAGSSKPGSSQDAGSFSGGVGHKEREYITGMQNYSGRNAEACYAGRTEARYKGLRLRLLLWYSGHMETSSPNQAGGTKAFAVSRSGNSTSARIIP